MRPNLNQSASKDNPFADLGATETENPFADLGAVPVEEEPKKKSTETTPVAKEVTAGSRPLSPEFVTADSQVPELQSKLKQQATDIGVQAELKKKNDELIAKRSKVTDQQSKSFVKGIEGLPENLLQSKDAKASYVVNFSKRTGADKNTLSKKWDEATMLRQRKQELEQSFAPPPAPTPAPPTTPPTADSRVTEFQKSLRERLPGGTKPELKLEGYVAPEVSVTYYSDQQLKDMAELADLYNYFGQHDKAKQTYYKLEGELKKRGEEESSDLRKKGIAVSNYIEQRQVPATQGLAYTAYLAGDKPESDRLYKLLKDKGLLITGEAVGTGSVMQPEAFEPKSRPTAESELMKGIAESGAGFPIIKQAYQMAEHGITKTIEALGDLNAKYSISGIPTQLPSAPNVEDAKNVLKLTTGLAESMAGVAGIATPVGAAYALPFFQVQNMVPAEVAEWMMPVSKLIRNYYAKQGKPVPETSENFGVLLDFATMALAHGAATKIKKSITEPIEAKKVAKSRAETFDEILNSIDPKEAELILKVAEKRRETVGQESPIEYVKQLDDQVKQVADGLKQAEAEIPVPEYNPPPAPESLRTITEGADVEMNGEIGKIERGDDGTWYFVNDKGESKQITVVDKFNPTEKLSELGIQVLPEISEADVARAAADAEMTGFVEYNGKRYFVSLDSTGKVNPIGDRVFEVRADGTMVDRFSSHPDPKFATDRMLAITNAFRESKGLPKRSKNITPWKESERYEVEGGTIAYEPETVNASGGKGQYMFYDAGGRPRVITEAEYARLKEGGKAIKVDGQYQRGYEGYEQGPAMPKVEVAPVEAPKVEAEVTKELSSVEETAKALEESIDTKKIKKADLKYIAEQFDEVKNPEKNGFNNTIGEGWKNATKEQIKSLQEGYWKNVNTEKAIAEAYHKAKADGSNPELVKAVEELLGKPEAPAPKLEAPAVEAPKVEAEVPLSSVEATAKALEEASPTLSDTPSLKDVTVVNAEDANLSPREEAMVAETISANDQAQSWNKALRNGAENLGNGWYRVGKTAQGESIIHSPETGKNFVLKGAKVDAIAVNDFVKRNFGNPRETAIAYHRGDNPAITQAVESLLAEEVMKELGDRKVPEGKGTWRKEFNKTEDPFRKSDILRAIADGSKSIDELNDIKAAAKDMPNEGNIMAVVDRKLKLLGEEAPVAEAPVPVMEAPKVEAEVPVAEAAPAKKELSPEVKAKNDLLKLVDKYNTLPKRERSVRGANLYARIQQEGKALGLSLSMNKSGRLILLDKKGRSVRKTPVKLSEETRRLRKEQVDEFNKARGMDALDIRHAILQFFMGGGKINEATLDSAIGKSLKKDIARGLVSPEGMAIDDMYTELLENNPQVMQRITDADLASYLGDVLMEFSNRNQMREALLEYARKENWAEQGFASESDYNWWIDYKDDMFKQAEELRVNLEDIHPYEWNKAIEAERMMSDDVVNEILADIDAHAPKTIEEINKLYEEHAVPEEQAGELPSPLQPETEAEFARIREQDTAKARAAAETEQAQALKEAEVELAAAERNLKSERIRVDKLRKESAQETMFPEKPREDVFFEERVTLAGRQAELKAAEDRYALAKRRVEELQSKRPSALRQALDDLKAKQDAYRKGFEAGGIAFDPKQQAQRLYDLHQAYFKVAKEAIKEGIRTIEEYAKLVPALTKGAVDAFEEAMGRRPKSKLSDFESKAARKRWEEPHVIKGQPIKSVIKKATEMPTEGLKDLKVRIKAEVKAAIEGYKKGKKEIREQWAAKDAMNKAFASAINDQMQALRGKIDPKVAKRLVKKALKATTPARMRAFEKFADKAISRANYLADFERASDLRSKLKKLVSGAEAAKKRGANNVVVIKELAKIRPEDIEDFDAYFDVAERVLESNKPPKYDKTTGQWTRTEPVINNAEVDRFIVDHLDRLEEQAKEEIKNEYQDLIDMGIIDPDLMSADDMYSIIESVYSSEDPITQKKLDEIFETQLTAIQQRTGILDMPTRTSAEDAARMSKMMQVQEQVLQAYQDLAKYSQANLEKYLIDEAQALTDRQRSTINDLIEIDTSLLSKDQASLVQRTIQNIIHNNSFAGADQVAGVIRFNQEAVKTVKELTKNNPMRELGTIDKTLRSKDMMLEKIAKTIDLTLDVKKASGIERLWNDVAKMKSDFHDYYYNKKKDSYIALREQLSKRDKIDYNDNPNRAIRGMYAKMIKNFGGSEIEKGAEFARHKRQVWENIKAYLSAGARDVKMMEEYIAEGPDGRPIFTDDIKLSERTKKLRQEGELLYEIYNKYFKDATNAEQLRDRLVNPNKYVITKMREIKNALAKEGYQISGVLQKKHKLLAKYERDFVIKDNAKNKVSLESLPDDLKKYVEEYSNLSDVLADYRKNRTKGNVELVDKAIEINQKNRNDVFESAEMDYNKVDIETQENYTRDKYKSSSDMPIDQKSFADTLFDTVFAPRNIRDKASGSMNRIIRKDTAYKGRLLNFDFDNVFRDALYEDMFSARTTKNINQLKELFRSRDAGIVFGSENNATAMRDFLKKAINIQRDEKVPLTDADRRVMKVIAQISFDAGRLALLGTSQVFKQFVGVAAGGLWTAGPTEAPRMLRYFAKGMSLANHPMLREFNISQRGTIMGGFFDPASSKITEKGLSERTMFDRVMETRQKIGEAIGKPLEKGDAGVARASWWMYYLDHLYKRGVDIESIDFADIKPDYDAAAYAEHMVSRMQNANDRASMPELYKSGNWSLKLIRDLAVPFSSFAINMRMRMAQDIDSVINGPKEDRIRALNSLNATVMEQFVFNSMKVYLLGNATAMGANLLSEYYDIDTKDKEKYKDAAFSGDKKTDSEKVFWNSIEDLALGGLPSFVKTPTKQGFNYMYNALTGTDEEFNNGPFFIYSNTLDDTYPVWLEYAGQYGTLGKTVVDVARYGEQAITGTTTGYEGLEAKLTEGERKAAWTAFIIDGAALLGVSDQDVSSLNSKLKRQLMKKYAYTYGGEKIIKVPFKPKSAVSFLRSGKTDERVSNFINAWNNLDDADREQMIIEGLRAGRVYTDAFEEELLRQDSSRKIYNRYRALYRKNIREAKSTKP
jgi:hypothetical protein